MRLRRLTFFMILFAACSTPSVRDPANVFRVDGAESILRPESDADRSRIRAEATFLNRRYGYVPDGSHRDLRGLRDLLDNPGLLASLHENPALEFGAGLTKVGYAFEPGDARTLVAAAADHRGRVLAAPPVVRMLAGLQSEGTLHDKAGRDLLRLRSSGADALETLAGLPDHRDRIASFGAGITYRFRPSDARALVREQPDGLDSADEAYLAELLASLEVDARPGYLPELRLLVEHRDETRAFFDLARGAKIVLKGPKSVLALSRLVRDHEPPPPADRERFLDLCGRLLWPDAWDMLHLMPLAAVPGVSVLVEELEDRYRYAFRSRDAADLVVLARKGLGNPSLPDWLEEDKAPLTRPGFLLSHEPAEAFAGPNDLLFLAELEKTRADLATMSLDRLAGRVRRDLRGFRVRYRLGAPYPEDARDLSGFLRPDLLKAILVMESLRNPATVERIRSWMRSDTRDRASERGGYARLTASGKLTWEIHEQPALSTRDDRLLLPRDPAAALEFHFHATDEDDTAYAGPSSGGPGTDLFRATRHRIDGIVFTRLPGEEFDTDLYTGGGQVLDLGIR